MEPFRPHRDDDSGLMSQAKREQVRRFFNENLHTTPFRPCRDDYSGLLSQARWEKAIRLLEENPSLTKDQWQHLVAHCEIELSELRHNPHVLEAHLISYRAGKAKGRNRLSAEVEERERIVLEKARQSFWKGLVLGAVIILTVVIATRFIQPLLG